MMNIKEKTNRNIKTALSGDISLRKAAIIAGVGYLISFIFTLVAGNFVDNIFVPGDAATTASNIMASKVLFRAGIVSWLIVIFGDMLRAWALYVFFKHVNKSRALFAAWFMLVHDAIFAIALLNLVFGVELLSGADYLTVFGTDQLQALMLLFFNGYNYGLIIGLFFFSFHLGTLGLLVYESDYIPRILSVLLIAGAIAFLCDSVGKILLPIYPEIIGLVLIVPMFIGELSFIVWLAIKGGKNRLRDDHLRASS